MLLTAAVLPNIHYRLKLTDPKVRLKQYCAAFEFWSRTSQRHGLELVAIENSGYGLPVLRRALGPSLLLETTAPDLSAEKGFAEAEMIREAVATLDLPGEALITKCTGRLTVPNFHRAVRLRTVGIQADLKTSLGMVDSRFFTVPARVAATHLSELATDVNEREGVYLEHVLRRQILLALAGGEQWVGWRTLPRIQGLSGTSGRRYGGPTQRLLRSAHNLQRSVALKRPFTL